jgi:alkylation response protein AidB-like acyl-CoA dehydrogenase
MDLQFTEAQERFRGEVREWLENHLPSEPPPRAGAELVAYQQAWQRLLADGSLVAVHFPREFGGQDLGWIETYIVQEELALAKAPEIVNRVAINLVGPTLLEHGSDAQQKRYLKKLVCADEIWCQLFSEPDAGSDLASLKTTATQVAGGWRVTGQKVWASNAQYSQRGVLLARTGTSERGRPEIGYFLISMDQPEISIRPLKQMTGNSDFNEVYFDRAFVEDEDVVGTPTNGWNVMRTTLGYERSTSPRQLIIHSILMDKLISQARAQRQTDTTRHRLAQLSIELRLYRLHIYRVLGDLERGEAPGPSSSVVKLFWSEMAQRMHELSVEMLGPQGMLLNDTRVRDEIYYRACTIFAGTSEIQRNTLAEQVLGLPRESRTDVGAVAGRMKLK